MSEEDPPLEKIVLGMGEKMYLLCIGHIVLVVLFCEKLNKILMEFSTCIGALVVLMAATEREEDVEAWLCATAWLHIFLKKWY